MVLLGVFPPLGAVQERMRVVEMLPDSQVSSSYHWMLNGRFAQSSSVLSADEGFDSSFPPPAAQPH